LINMAPRFMEQIVNEVTQVRPERRLDRARLPRT